MDRPTDEMFWRAGRHVPWPEDHGETTPRHGPGPTGEWRDWRGMPPPLDPAGGWHVGKGPRGYTRSDDRIREDVCDRLTDDPYVDATDIEVAVAAGEVTLSGLVRRRADKRRAEDIADHVSGVRDVNNRLRVASAADAERTPTAPDSRS